MPFIKSKVSVPLSKEQEKEIKTKMGKAIELVPGKSEHYLLLEFEDNCRLWLRGKKDDPIVYIEAAIFGNESHQSLLNILGFSDIHRICIIVLVFAEQEIYTWFLYIRTVTIRHFYSWYLISQ